MNLDLSLADKAQFLRAVFDASPIATFIVNGDMVILDYNLAAAVLLGPNPDMALHHRGGEAMHCVHAETKGCGRGLPCQSCIVRSSVLAAIAHNSTHRKLHKAELRTPAGVNAISLLVTATPLPSTDRPLVLLMLEDISELMTLRGLLPICASCKKVRDDQGYWHQIERYIRERSSADFSHSICPDCARRLYPEYSERLGLNAAPLESERS